MSNFDSVSMSSANCNLNNCLLWSAKANQNCRHTCMWFYYWGLPSLYKKHMVGLILICNKLRQRSRGVRGRLLCFRSFDFTTVQMWLGLGSSNCVKAAAKEEPKERFLSCWLADKFYGSWWLLECSDCWSLMKIVADSKSAYRIIIGNYLVMWAICEEFSWVGGG